MEKNFDLLQMASEISKSASFDKDDTSIVISGDYCIPESGVVNLLQYAAKAFGKEFLAGAIRSGDGNWTGTLNIQFRNLGTLIEKVYPMLRDKHLIDRKEQLEDLQFNEKLQKLQSGLDEANSRCNKLLSDLEEARESKANLEAELAHVNEILKENHEYEFGPSEK